MPRIVLDGGVLQAQPWTGVQRAFLATLAAYARLAPAPPLLLLPPPAPDPELAGVEVAAMPGGRLARQTRLPRLLLELGAGLLHSPVTALPLRAPCPVVATVHDLPWMSAFALREPGCRFAERLKLRVAARAAAALIVPSVATANDVLGYLGRGVQSRVHVVPHGVALPAAPAPAEDLTGPMLVLGDDRPRKNVARLRAAHARARALAPDLPELLLLGPGFRWVSEDEKLARLRRSRALLHVALHEGFGLPVLEAFAHGVPVLCSDIGVLREVAGGAALHVDPTDTEAIARAIVRLHRDGELRARLRALGFLRARSSTLEAAAERWAAIHAALLVPAAGPARACRASAC